MEAVNTKVMSFAPDVGQLQKGGSNAAQVVKDFAKITNHMHLKDYSNGKYGRLLPAWYGCGGYRIHPEHTGTAGPQSGCDTRARSWKRSDKRTDTAISSKAYLTRLGYKFRS